MAKFTLEFSENEILQVICALGAAHPMPPIMANKNEDPADAIGLCCKIFALMIAQTMRDTVPHGTLTTNESPWAGATGVSGPLRTESLLAEAQPSLQVGSREYWTPKAKRDTAESLEFVPVKIERKDIADKKRLIVSWQNTATNQRGYLQASCFEESLFGPIANRVKQRTLFYIVRSGKYINIVGLVS